MQPEETLQAHRDLRGKWLLPIHNGTFDLALHAWREPLDRITALAEAQQQNSEQLTEIKGLRQVLIDQNESIDRLHQLTEQARVKSEAALKVAEMQNKNIEGIV